MNGMQQSIKFHMLGYYIEFRIFILNQKKYNRICKKIDHFIKTNEYEIIEIVK